MPLMFMFVFATVEICNALFLKQTLSLAAYEGARVAIIPGADEDNVLAQIQEVLGVNNIQGGSGAIEPVDFFDQPAGTFVKVTVAAPPENNSAIHRLFFGQA